MIQLSCLCGQVRAEVARRPDYINECNCTLCRKAGARWGYFHPSEVSIDGETRGYSRQDKPIRRRRSISARPAARPRTSA